MNRFFTLLIFSFCASQSLIAEILPHGEMLTEINGHYISPGSFHPREYCMRKSYARVKVICEDYNVDDDGNPMAFLKVLVKIDQKKFSWSQRHISYLADCTKSRTHLGRSLAKIPYNALFCIRGWELIPDPKKDPEPADKKYGTIVETIYYNNKEIFH